MKKKDNINSYLCYMFKKRIILEKNNVYRELQNIRRKNGITLETMQKETKIPIKHLKALEEGSTKLLPDIIYTKNIIKKYLSFFNVDAGPFITGLNLERKEKESPEKPLDKKTLVVIPRIIKSVVIIFFTLALIVYLGLSISKIFKPPSIIITSPIDGKVTSKSIISVEGSTERGTKLFINNEQVLLDQDSNFNKEINLQKGLNLIKISGVNRYSKENVIWRNVILEIN
ncbi:helix-turn-helix domain-containing protein [Patescibacteria group bacterium]